MAKPKAEQKEETLIAEDELEDIDYGIDQGQKSTVTDKAWEKMTGRDMYFKPEANINYKLVITGWKPQEMGLKNELGLSMQVLSINGVPVVNENNYKLWNTSSKRIIRQIEPFIREADNAGKKQIVVVFRKTMAAGEESTEAKFTVLKP
jgi:hypothetical protein